MFVAEVPHAPYRDPWLEEFEDRFARLRRGDVRVAYYYHHPDNSTFRYRCYNMAQVIEGGMTGVSAAHFCAADAEGLERVIDAADVLVICRARYTDKLNRMAYRARGLGRRVVYDIDDLVFDPDYAHLVMNTLAQEPTEEGWEHWFAYFARLGATMKLCDRVVVTNDYLAERARAYAGQDVRVVPNFINREQLDLSHRLFEAKRASGWARDHRIHVGYFSGTPTHAKDFEIVAGAMAHLMDRRPEVMLRRVGFLDPPECLSRHAVRIDRVPLLDFVNLQRAMGAVEINIVPLQDNAFTNCKSELKYFEAGAVGTVTVASPTFTYRSSIQDSQNGYLARTHEWEATLDRLLDGFDGYGKTAEQAFEDSVGRYAWTRQGPAIAAALLQD